MEYRSAIIEMSKKSGSKDVGVKRGGVANLTDPHVINDNEDEGGGDGNAFVVEGAILDSNLPDVFGSV